MQVRFSTLVGACWLIFLAACASTGSPPLLSPRLDGSARLSRLRLQAPPPRPAPRKQVVTALRKYLGGAPLAAGGYSFSGDPVGLVRAAFWSAGIELMQEQVMAGESDSMTALYRSAQVAHRLHLEQPRVGDLIFFSEQPGRQQGVPVQVAVVESIDAAGTITAIGVFAEGLRRIALNLRQPQQLADSRGKPINDLLAHAGGKPSTAAELARVFVDPF